MKESVDGVWIMLAPREVDQWVRKMKCSGATGLDISHFPELKVANPRTWTLAPGGGGALPRHPGQPQP